jgi:hypothetical protein
MKYVHQPDLPKSSSKKVHRFYIECNQLRSVRVPNLFSVRDLNDDASNRTDE